jgi:hypothetical protein
MKNGAISPKGRQAARLRRRKRQLLAHVRLPPEGLPGSLAHTHRRCGKASCHCAQGKGHPVWSLTFMLQGRKRVERIPEEWVAWVRQRVGSGRKFKEAVGEVWAINAQLLALGRQQQRRWGRLGAQARRLWAARALAQLG